MLKPKNILLLALIVLLTDILNLLNRWSSGITIFDNLSPVVNKNVVYQPITLAITIILLWMFSRLKRSEFLAHFRKGNTSAEILPEKWVGIKPKPTENWFHFGRNFAIIITLVTATVIYFQLVKGSDFSVLSFIKVLPFAVLFAITNSFVEESITRLGVVVALKDAVSDKRIAMVSAGIFGCVHYFGNPGGLVGVLVAGFLGWLLAKSILETKGMFWAWLIHFLQDVIIFSALLIIQ